MISLYYIKMNKNRKQRKYLETVYTMSGHCITMTIYALGP